MSTSGSVGNLHLSGQRVLVSSPPVPIRRCRDAQQADCSTGIVSIELALELRSSVEGGVVVDHQALTTIAPYYRRVSGAGGSTISFAMGDPDDQAGIRDHWESSGNQKLHFGILTPVSSRDGVELFLCAEPDYAPGGAPLCPAHTDIEAVATNLHEHQST
ncbi:hypothetical protein [Stenotrophomonas sp. AB1(2024)]|uniref:hypothetical protein n=1 Tax=Stenotrophomonas sp. AB1(2024) TaxID=3132215 RepID=UPI0030965844